MSDPRPSLQQAIENHYKDQARLAAEREPSDLEKAWAERAATSRAHRTESGGE